MLIPIRCFTCGKPIAHLYEEYTRRLHEHSSQQTVRTVSDLSDLSQPSPVDTILNDLGLTRLCCRRTMISHVDILPQLSSNAPLQGSA